MLPAQGSPATAQSGTRPHAALRAPPSAGFSSPFVSKMALDERPISRRRRPASPQASRLQIDELLGCLWGRSHVSVLPSGLSVGTEGLGCLRLRASSLPRAPPVPGTARTQNQRGRGADAPSGAHPQPLPTPGLPLPVSLSAPDPLLASGWLLGEHCDTAITRPGPGRLRGALEGSRPRRFEPKARLALAPCPLPLNRQVPTVVLPEI